MTVRRWISWMIAWVVFLGFAGAALAQDVVEDAGNGLGAASPYDNWQIVLGIVAPLVLQFLLRPGWSREKQTLAAFAFSTIAVLGGMYLDGTLLLNFDVVTTPLKVFPLIWVFYQGFWKAIGVTPSNSGTKENRVTV